MSGIALPMRSWVLRVERAISDITTSTHYSGKYDHVFACGIQTVIKAEARVEGTFRLDYVPRSVLLDLFDGEYISRVVFGLDNQTVFCDGMFLVSDFVIESSINDAVVFSCRLNSQGVFDLPSVRYHQPLDGEWNENPPFWPV